MKYIVSIDLDIEVDVEDEDAAYEAIENHEMWVTIRNSMDHPNSPIQEYMVVNMFAGEVGPEG